MLELQSTLIGNIIALLFISLPVSAQVVPDKTLGGESSTIKSIDELRSRIEGGAIRGENLFHSFEEFNIREGLEVYFANPEEISNIFSRVTGNNISEIFGTLGVEGAANLFLINPNGIVFGENARIDVGGSFIATTAEGVHFEDGKVFNVSDREKPILTWNAPIGLELEKTSGKIVVRGEGNNLEIPIPEFNINRENRPTGIEVEPNKTIGLLGSKITLESGNLTAPGGRIELGSVIGNESVGLVSTDSGWKLNYEEVTNFGDISLLQEASIDTSGESSGAIQLRGRQINIKDGSAVLANTLGNSTGEGITIKSDVLELSGATTDNFVSAIATDNIEGVGGNIDINTSQLYMADGSQIRAIVFGEGVTGEVNIDAEDIEVTGVNSLNFDYLTSIETSVATESVGGTGKDVNINTKNLLVSGGGRILTDTFGIGNAGDLIVKAENIDLIEFENRELGLLTGLSTATRQESTEGNAGNIVVNVSRLRLIDGARIRADAASTGNGGNISINASSIELSGISPFNSAAKSTISTSTSDSGNGGDITINAGNLILEDGALINANTSGSGDGGDINIIARNINLSGSNPIDSSFFFRGISSSVGFDTTGNGGEININTENLRILEGSQIRASTFSDGDGGSINISAENIDVIGLDSTNTSRFSNIIAKTDGDGKGGTIDIETSNLKVANGAQIDANTNINSGDAGNITIDARNMILKGYNYIEPESFTGITTSSNEGFGTGGSIKINTDSLIVKDGSQIRASTTGSEAGNAGSIEIFAKDTEISGKNPAASSSFNSTDIPLTSGVFVFSSGSGNAGNISLTTQKLSLNSEGTVEARASQTGNAGSVSLNTNSLTISDRASVTVQNDGAGNAGSIDIDANSINLNTEGNISAAALLGEGGNINIQSDRLTSNNSLISASAGEGSGGNIEVNSDRITTNNSDITAASLSQQGGNLELIGDRFIFSDSNFNASAEDLGNGGNVFIDADTVLGINSDITATAERGDGGNITIDADGVLGFREGEATKNDGNSDVDATSRFGQDGTVIIINPLTTTNDPLIALIENFQNSPPLALVGDCYNSEGEPLVTNSVHDDIPETSDDYLDYSGVISDDETVDVASTEATSNNKIPTEADISSYLADTVVQTEDGRIYLVNKGQLERLEKRGCLEVREGEE